MKTSLKGRVEIASHEGVVLSRYRDSVNVWTIGIGHTAGAGDPNPARVTRELAISEVMEIFARDLAKFERRVAKAFTHPLTQRQFDAAVSFDFNTGGIHRASWVRKFNQGDIAGARKAFMNWSKPREIIPRREKERDLFFGGAYASGGYANVYPASATGKVQWSKGRRVDIAKLLQEPPDPVVSPPPSPKSVQPAPSGFFHALLRVLAKLLGKV